MENDDSSTSATILDILNEDCWRLILDLLHVKDIIQSERVSRQWQHMIFQYLHDAHFSIQYRCYKHEFCNYRILTLDKKDPEHFDMIVRKWGWCIKRVDCVDKVIVKDTLEVLARNCPNLELITFYKVHEDFLTNESLDLFEKLKQVRFRRCRHVTDACISQWLALDTVEDLAIFYADQVSGLFLTTLQSTKLKSLCIWQCKTLELRHLLSAADCLTGLTKLELFYLPKDIFQYVHLLLDKMPDLEDLCLVWPKKIELGDELAESVCRLGRLRRLDVRFNPNVNDAWLEAVARGSRLQELVVDGCTGLSGEGLAAACRALGPALRALHAGSRGHVDNEHVEACVLACPNLTFVDLSYNMLVSEHVVGMAAAAARGRRLRLQVESTMVEGHDEDEYPWLTLDFSEWPHSSEASPVASDDEVTSDG